MSPFTPPLSQSTFFFWMKTNSPLHCGIGYPAQVSSLLVCQILIVPLEFIISKYTQTSPHKLETEVVKEALLGCINEIEPNIELKIKIIISTFNK